MGSAIELVSGEPPGSRPVTFESCFDQKVSVLMIDVAAEKPELLVAQRPYGRW